MLVKNIKKANDFYFERWKEYAFTFDQG